MKKQLLFITLCLATALSAAAKAGDRFEWNPYPDHHIQNHGSLVLEVVSDETKTLKVVDICPSDINTPIRYIYSTDSESVFKSPLPEKYRDYRVVEICDKAFYNPDLGKNVQFIYIYDIPVIGDYAFFGSCRRNLPDQPPALQILEMRNVESIGEYAFANSEIEMIYMYNATPPDAHINTFSDITYKRCKLYIPYRTWSVYHEHPVWGRFAYKQTCLWVEDVDDVITETINYHVSGHEIIVNGATDGTALRLYDMTGRCVDAIVYQRNNINTLTAPSAGIYILHYAGKTHKILIKP